MRRRKVVFEGKRRGKGESDERTGDREGGKQVYEVRKIWKKRKVVFEGTEEKTLDIEGGKYDRKAGKSEERARRREGQRVRKIITHYSDGIN